MTIAPVILREFQAINDAQRDVVAHDGGPLLVIAGPGSGKTFALVLRTINLLILEKSKPSQIIVCTFTEKAAYELRDRIAASARRVGYHADLSELNVGTIHGICNRLLQAHRHRTPLGNSYDTLDDLTQLLFLFEHFDEIVGPLENGIYLGKWRTKWSAIEGLRDYLNKITEELVDPDLLSSATPGFLQSLGRAYKAYRDLLLQHNKIDFAFQQKLVYDLLLNPEFLNAAIYQFLNIMSKDPALNQLRGKHCLWIEGAYRAPNEVFWGAHPFGRYRWRLGEELRSYGDLLRVLQVRDTPDYQDVLLVLREISDQFTKTNSPLDDHALAVLMPCWQTLENALTAGGVSSAKLGELHEFKCIPNATRVLNPPDWVFFENRAGLAEKFGDFLLNNVIPRPLGAGNALSAAGVRPLGSAVTVEVLECADPKDSPEVLEKIRKRKNEIGRVLESQASSQDSLAALSKLDNIRCQVATKLVARFRLKVFNRDLTSTPEQIGNHIPA